MSTNDVRILHDGSFSTPGGGERVALELARALDAPVTVAHSARPEWWGRAGPDIDIEFAFQQALHGPTARVLPRAVRELRLGRLMRTVDLDETTIVSTGTTAKWWVPRADQRHVHYCHTPPPRFYGAGQGGGQSFPGWYLQQQAAQWDQHFASFVDDFLANSDWTRRRVRKHYGRGSTVLNPPVRTERFGWAPPRQDPYVVCVPGRLVEMKRPVTVAEGVAALDADLAIVGDGPLRADCERLPGVTVYPDLSDAAVELLVSRAVAGIAFAAGEHCGITPKEFQAAGKPVVVPDEPNLCNHVTDGETGFVVDPTVEGVAEGVRRVLSADWDRERIEAAADGWSTEEFHDRARELVLGIEADRDEDSGDRRPAPKPEPASELPEDAPPVAATDGGER